MEVEADEVRAALKKVPPVRKAAATLAFTNRGGTERSVLVERKPSRRVISRPVSRSVG
jgi:hypothetical protein